MMIMMDALTIEDQNGVDCQAIASLLSLNQLYKQYVELSRCPSFNKLVSLDSIGR